MMPLLLFDAVQASEQQFSVIWWTRGGAEGELKIVIQGTWEYSGQRLWF